MTLTKLIPEGAGHPAQVKRKKAKAKARKSDPKAQKDQEASLLQERRILSLVAFTSKGICNKGKECDFYHAPVCKFFKSGSCSRGLECTFAHVKAATPAKTKDEVKSKDREGDEPKSLKTKAKVTYVAHTEQLLKDREKGLIAGL